MTVRSELLRVLQQEDINFLLTNRIPRRLVTQFIGWFSRIEQPLVRDLSIGTWRLFSDLDLREAKKTSFRSMHDCFVRELKDGARPIDRRADVLVSPCDAIVGACGAIAGTRLYQAKGFPYALGELLPERDLVERAPQRPLCHAAAHREHVSPLPCAARLPRRTRRLRVGRYLERQSDRAQADRAAVLQERTRHREHPARGRRPSGDAGRGRRHPCRQHTPALSRRAAQPAPSRPQRHRLRCELPQRRGAGLVRARLDNHRLCARQVSRCATMSAKAPRFASASR